MCFIGEFDIISPMNTQENTLLLLAEKDALILQLQKENETLKEIVSLLQEQVKLLQKKFFGKQSERFVDHQLELPGMGPELASEGDIEDEESDTIDIPAHKKKKAKQTPKNTISYPDDLPVEREVRDLPEQEKIDAKTGEALVCIGEDVTRRLAKKAAHFVIKEIIRKKYAYLSNPDTGIKTAELPDSLLNRCPVHESFLQML